MNARTYGIFLSFLALAPGIYAGNLPTEFDGYVTRVVSKNEFDIGSRRITLNQYTILAQRAENMESTPGAPLSPCAGMLLHVEGEFDKGTFVAKTILLPLPPATQNLNGIGLIEEKALLQSNGGQVTGTIWVDGYPLQVTPKTKLLSADGKIYPADQIKTNVWAAFQAVRKPDRSIGALSITFDPNTVTADEIKFRDKSEPEILPPDYSKHIPGKIRFRYRGAPSIPWALEIVPDKAVQDYVTKVGESLIPQYQRDLPAGDPAKINFRFFVVEKPSKWKETLNDASSTAGGVIYVPDNVLAVLNNEAQLAALLSNCIATTLEKQFYAHRGRLKAQEAVAWAQLVPVPFGITSAVGIGNSLEFKHLMLEMNENASRIGLRYMLHAGYDLSEAPFAWTAAANETIENPLWEGNFVPPLVRSVMTDLSCDYASTDYSNLKTNRDAYQQMLTELRAAVPKLPKPKNHPDNSREIAKQ